MNERIPTSVFPRPVWIKIIVLGLTLALFTLLGCQGGSSEVETKKTPGGSLQKEGANGSQPIRLSLTDRGGWWEAVDSFDRVLALVPSGQKPPEGFPATRIINIPVRRMISASGPHDLGIIAALGRLDTIVGMDEPSNAKQLPEVMEAYKNGAIEFVGYSNGLDFETMRRLKPDVVLCNNLEIAGILESFGFSVVTTYNSTDNDLANRVRLFAFLGTLLGREAEAQAMGDKLKDALSEIKNLTAGLPRLKYCWVTYSGDRPFPLYGDYWLSEIFTQCGGDNVWGSILGGSTQIELEKFLSGSNEAELFFTSILYEGAIDDKEDYLRHHPELARLKIFGPGGRVYVPLVTLFLDTGHLDEVAKDVAAIVHPSLWPDRELRYFKFLP
jgi:iron complex transport system substrate-binding protein